MKTEAHEFPLLTKEKLAVWERKVDMGIATLEELELIDHYMTSINDNDIIEELVREGIYSLEEYLILLKVKGDYEETKAARLTGHLLGCIHVLQSHVQRGEKIY